MAGNQTSSLYFTRSYPFTIRMGFKKAENRYIVLTDDNRTYLVKLLKEHGKNLDRLSKFYSYSERERVLSILEADGI